MTGISYLDETWSPQTGCSGKGCPTKDTCWAKAMVKRFPMIHGYEPESEDGIIRGWGELPFEKVQFHPDRLDKPLHWRKPRRIGVCFLGDLFDEQVPDEWIDKVFYIILDIQHHNYFILTKQIKRMTDYFDRGLRIKCRACNGVGCESCYDSGYLILSFIPSQIYSGVSITSQADADRMIPELLRIPGGKHWVSYEPALGPVNLAGWGLKMYLRTIGSDGSAERAGLDWVVLGCESGPHRRPCHHEWMIDIVEQCRAAGVRVWVKQIDLNGKVCHNITKFPKALQFRELP